MRMRTMEISVGAFILAGFLALVFLLLNISGLQVSSSQETYRVQARFENIGGLTTRARVTLSGVTIGKVTQISIDTQTLNALVEMEIDQSVDYLSADSSAAILTAGLLGEKYIGITIGADDRMLKDGSMIADTQSALVLEELIGKFLFDKVK